MVIRYKFDGKIPYIKHVRENIRIKRNDVFRYLEMRLSKGSMDEMKMFNIIRYVHTFLTAYIEALHFA